MNNNQRYVIDGKHNGLFRMLVALAISVTFAILAVDQLIGGEGKRTYLGLLFSVACISSLFVSVPLIVRYFFFKVCVNENDFYIRTTPFNAKTYKYSEVKNVRTELKSSRASSIKGTSQTAYFYCFYFTDNYGKIHKFQFEKSTHEKEIEVLSERINSN